jgi:hypothetical protein
MASSIVNDLMHMPGMHPQSPEWYSAQFIGCVFRGILDDAIAGCDVMQEKITVRVNNLAAEGLRHRECSAIDGSTRRTLTEPFSPTVLPIGGNVPVRAQGISVFGTK